MLPRRRRLNLGVSAHINAFLPLAAIAMTYPSNVSVKQSPVVAWATATSTDATNGRVIIFRYAKDFRETFDKSGYPVRLIIEWPFQTSTGLPETSEREEMDRFEDLLAPSVEESGESVLAIVSTGENVREWVYYARSEESFLGALNEALADEPPFSIRIHAANDPGWSFYGEFRAGVRE
jgi:hypothetical protein